MALYSVQVTGYALEEVYLDLAGVDQYIGGMIGRGAAAWRDLKAAADDDSRKQLIISATRAIDQLEWEGVAELAAYTGGGSTATTLQFPRTGLLLDGVAPTEAQQLALVQKAMCELVAVFAASNAAAAQADQGSNVKALGAGSARVEFFSPTSIDRGTATVLPAIPQRLIGMWLASGVGTVQLSTGGTSATGACSNFHGHGEKRWDPF